eukprot:TRINITY_DN8_c0_g2_i8.p1 TRINITY_DN8_c0_g2~~TRINITY_DN8_c0_g2_i8.p1  ORF type:complete len:2611 (+),score=1174.93 TRINITY_DN8_c0_g2_i8:1304-9136(+)
MFRVSRMTQLPHSEQTWKVDCHNAGLTDAIQDGDVTTEIRGSPSAVRDEFTGEVEDLTAKAQLKRDQATLHSVAKSYQQAHADAIRDELVQDKLDTLRSKLWELASNAVPKSLLTTKTMPAMIKATTELADELQDDAKDLFYDQAQPAIENAIHRATIEAQDDDFVQDDQIQEESDAAELSDSDDLVQEQQDILDSEPEDLAEDVEVQDQDQGRLRKLFRKARKAFKKFGKRLVKGIKKYAKKLLKAVGKFAGTVLKTLKNTVSALLKGDFKAVFAEFKKLANKVLGAIKALSNMQANYVKAVKIGKRVQNRVLFKKQRGDDFAEVTLEDANASFVPKFTFAFKLRSFRLKFLKIVLEGNLNVTLTMMARVSYAFKKTKNLKLLSFKGARVSFMAGPVPIWITATFDIFVGFTVRVHAKATVRFGGRLSSGVAIGVVFQNKKFKGLFQRHFKHEIIKPTGPPPTALVSFEGFVKPRVSFLLYGVTGPTFIVEPYLQAILKVSKIVSWEVLLGARGFCGVRAQVLGKDLFNKNYKLFSEEKVIAKGQFNLKAAVTAKINSAKKNVDIYDSDDDDEDEVSDSEDQNDEEISVDDEDLDVDQGLFRRRRRRRKLTGKSRTKMAEMVAAKEDVRDMATSDNLDKLNRASNKLSGAQTVHQRNLLLVKGVTSMNAEKKKNLINNITAALKKSQKTMITNFVTAQRIEDSADELVEKAGKVVGKEITNEAKAAGEVETRKESSTSTAKVDEEDDEAPMDDVTLNRYLNKKTLFNDKTKTPTVSQAELRRRFNIVETLNDRHTMTTVPSTVSDEDFFGPAYTNELSDSDTRITPTGEMSEEKFNSLKDYNHEYKAHTKVRGTVEVHPQFIAIDDAHHQHMVMVRRPTNKVMDPEDPINLLQHSTNKIFNRVAQMAQEKGAQNLKVSHEDVMDIIKDDDEDEREITAQSWNTDRKKMLAEGSIAGEFIIPTWLKNKYQIVVGTMFSVPTGLFKVKHISRVDQTEKWQLRCEHTGLLNVINNADTHTEVMGAPSMAREEDTGEVTDLSAEGAVLHDKMVLENMFKDWKETVVQMRHRRLIKDKVAEFRTMVAKHATNVLPTHLVNVERLPEMGKAAARFADEVAGHAQQMMEDQARPLLKKQMEAETLEQDDDDFIADEDLEEVESENDDMPSQTDDEDAMAMDVPEDEQVDDDNGIIRKLARAGRSVGRAIGRVTRAISKAFKKMADRLKKFGAALVKSVSAYASAIWNYVKEKFTEVIEAIAKAITDFVKNIVDKVKAQFNKLVKLVKAIANGLMGKFDLDYEKGLKYGKEVHNKELFSAEKGGASTTITLEKGEAIINPKFVLQLQVRKWKLKKFRAALEAKASLALKFVAEFGYEYEKEISKKIVTFSGKRIKFFIGPIPVWVSISPYVDGGATLSVNAASTLQFGGALSTGITIGVEYKDKKWQSLFEKYFKRELYLPKKLSATVSVTFEVFLSPRIAFLLYDVAGPTFTLQPYLQLVFEGEGEVSKKGAKFEGQFDIFLGIRGKVGVVIGLMGKNLLDKEWDLFDKSKKIYTGKIKLGRVQDALPAGDDVIYDDDSDAELDAVVEARLAGAYKEQQTYPEFWKAIDPDQDISDEEANQYLWEHPSTFDASEWIEGGQEIENDDDEEIEDQDRDEKFWSKMLQSKTKDCEFIPTKLDKARAEKAEAQNTLRKELEAEMTKDLVSSLEDLYLMKKKAESNLEQVQSLKTITEKKKAAAIASIKKNLAEAKEGIKKNLEETEETKESIRKRVEESGAHVPYKAYEEKFKEWSKKYALRIVKTKMNEKKWTSKQRAQNNISLKMTEMYRKYWLYLHEPDLARARYYQYRLRVEFGSQEKFRPAMDAYRLLAEYLDQLGSGQEVDAKLYEHFLAASRQAAKNEVAGFDPKRGLPDMEIERVDLLRKNNKCAAQKEANAWKKGKYTGPLVLNEQDKVLIAKARARLGKQGFKASLKAVEEAFGVAAKLKSVKGMRAFVHVVREMKLQMQLFVLFQRVLPPKVQKVLIIVFQVMAFFRRYPAAYKIVKKVYNWIKNRKVVKKVVKTVKKVFSKVRKIGKRLLGGRRRRRRRKVMVMDMGGEYDQELSDFEATLNADDLKVINDVRAKFGPKKFPGNLKALEVLFATAKKLSNFDMTDPNQLLQLAKKLEITHVLWEFAVELLPKKLRDLLAKAKKWEFLIVLYKKYGVKWAKKLGIKIPKMPSVKTFEAQKFSIPEEFMPQPTAAEMKRPWKPDTAEEKKGGNGSGNNGGNNGGNGGDAGNNGGNGGDAGNNGGDGGDGGDGEDGGEGEDEEGEDEDGEDEAEPGEEEEEGETDCKEVPARKTKSGKTIPAKEICKKTLCEEADANKKVEDSDERAKKGGAKGKGKGKGQGQGKKCTKYPAKCRQVKGKKVCETKPTFKKCTTDKKTGKRMCQKMDKPKCRKGKNGKPVCQKPKPACKTVKGKKVCSKPKPSNCSIVKGKRVCKPKRKKPSRKNDKTTGKGCRIVKGKKVCGGKKPTGKQPGYMKPTESSKNKQTQKYKKPTGKPSYKKPTGKPSYKKPTYKKPAKKTTGKQPGYMAPTENSKRRQTQKYKPPTKPTHKKPSSKKPAKKSSSKKSSKKRR